jgi:hypothetical protein
MTVITCADVRADAAGAADFPHVPDPNQLPSKTNGVIHKIESFKPFLIIMKGATFTRLTLAAAGQSSVYLQTAKLGSILNVPFAIISIGRNGRALWNADTMTVAVVASSNFLDNIGGFLDSISTFVKELNSFNDKIGIEWTKVVFPIGSGLAVFGVISNGIGIYRTFNMNADMNKTLNEKNGLQNLLSEIVKDSDEHLEHKFSVKDTTEFRKTTNEALKALETGDDKQALLIVKSLKGRVHRKIAAHAVGVVTPIISISAVFLTSVVPGCPLLLAFSNVTNLPGKHLILILSSVSSGIGLSHSLFSLIDKRFNAPEVSGL